MQTVEVLASLIPAGGSIVEVGSLLGLSSWIWAKSADPTVKVYCIDPWETVNASNFVSLARTNQQEFTKTQFLRNVDDCENIVALQGYSPNDFTDWKDEIDLYFEDAVHTDPIFSQNLDFWKNRLKPDGILCGHDYHPKFPDVCNGAARSAKALGRTLRVIGALWFLLPRSMETSTDPAVQAALERLKALEDFIAEIPAPAPAEDVVAYSRRVVGGIDAFDYELEVDDIPHSVRHGEPIEIRGFVRNLTGSDWPVILLDKAVLKVGAELRLATGGKLAVARGFVPRPIVRAGERVEFVLEVDTSRAPVGPVSIDLDLVYDHVRWFREAAERTELKVDIASALDFDRVDPNVPVGDKRFWLQHIKEYSPQTDIGITVVKEQDYVIHAAAGDIPARSMLTSYELALLFGLARHYCTGQGKIVDLGPLVGVGTYVMARGIALNDKFGEKSKSIFSFDLFLMERMDHFLPTSDNSGTGSVFNRFLEINREYLDIVCPVPGDVLSMKWTGEPIEVLFVDLAKSWDLNRHVVQEFFPALIPGRSILIQQDYVHVGEPWVALQMEVFRDYFEHLYFVYGASSVYLLTKPLPEALLKLDLRSLPSQEIDAHFVAARDRAPPSVGEVLKCCQAAIKIERGDLDGAQALLDSVNRAIVDVAERPENFIPAIPANLNAARRWLDHGRRAASAPKAAAPAAPAPAAPAPAVPSARFTTSQFIKSTYLGILGRAADPVGLEGWTKRLEREPMHRLPTALVHSPEFLVSFTGQKVKQDAGKAVASINNRLSLATLAAPLHKLRCELVVNHLPQAKEVLDLGGASATDEGALLLMGYRGAERISIVELPPDIRSKKAPERAKTGQFFGTQVQYKDHSMTELSSYADSSVDFIWSGQTIERVTLTDGDAIFQQARRVLKPGGFLALDTPNRTLTRLAVGDDGFIHAEHKHEYCYEELVERHRSADLKLVQSKGLIDMRRSIATGYLLPDEIAAGAINGSPESSFAFFTVFQKAV